MGPIKKGYPFFLNFEFFSTFHCPQTPFGTIHSTEPGPQKREDRKAEKVFGINVLKFFNVPLPPNTLLVLSIVPNLGPKKGRIRKVSE